MEICHLGIEIFRVIIFYFLQSWFIKTAKFSAYNKPNF